MGIQDNGAFGGFRGKTGPLVGRRVKGRNVISALPHPSNHPKQAAQLTQNLKHRLLTALLSELLVLVRVGFKDFAKRGTSSNAAYSYNYGRIFKVVEGQVSLDFPKLVFSRGSVATPNCASAARVDDTDGNTSIAFSWLAERESQFNRVTDLATFLVFNEDNWSGPVVVQDAVSRSALGYVVGIPGLSGAERLHCFMSFKSADGKLVGDSVYAAEV